MAVSGTITGAAYVASRRSARAASHAASSFVGISTLRFFAGTARAAASDAARLFASFGRRPDGAAAGFGARPACSPSRPTFAPGGGSPDAEASAGRHEQHKQRVRGRHARARAARQELRRRGVRHAQVRRSVAASPRSGAAAGGGRRGTGAARAVAASACSFMNRLANPSLRALGRRDRRPVAAFRTHGGAGESRPETGGEDAPSRVDFSPGPSSRSSQLWSVTQPPSARFAPALFSGVGRPCGWWCACFVGEGR